MGTRGVRVVVKVPQPQEDERPAPSIRTPSKEEVVRTASKEVEEVVRAPSKEKSIH